MTTLSLLGVAQFVAGIALNYLTRSDGPNIEGPRRQDLSVSGSSYGEVWPLVYGTKRLPSNMIWADEITEIKLEESAGGKGGGGGTITTYEYFADFAVGICEGPIQKVLQIFADGKLIYDTTGTGKVISIYEGVSRTALRQVQETRQGTFTVDNTQQEVTLSLDGSSVGDLFKDPFSVSSLPVRLYLGDEQQLPDPLIESVEGVGKVSAHRGLCYAVFEKLPLKGFGNRIPNLSFIVSTNANNLIVRQAANDSGLGINAFNFTVDSRRRRIFAGDLSTMGRWDYDSLTKLMENSNAKFNSVPGTSISAAKNGNVFLVQGSSNSEPLIKFDGTSLETLETSNTTVNLPISDIASIAVTNIREMGVTVDFTLVSQNQGGVQIFLDRAFDNNLLTLGSLTDVTPAGFEGQLAGGDFSQADGVGGPIVVDQVNEVIYAFQNWTTGSIDNTAPIVLWKITILAIALPTNQLSAVAFPEEVIRFPRNDAVNGFPGSENVGNVFYLEGDNSLIIQGSGDTIKFDLNSNSIVARTSSLPAFGPSMSDLPITGGVFAFANGGSLAGNFYEVSTANLEILRATPISTVEANSTVNNNVFDEETFSILTNKNGMTRYFLNRAEGGGAALSAIVQDICVRAGLLATDIDVSALTGITVQGFAANAQSSARRNIEALMQAFFFDAVEIDGVLEFRLRGRAVDRVLDFDDLGELVENQGLPDPSDGRIIEERVEEIEIPHQVWVKFEDKDRSYQAGAAQSSRISEPAPTMFSEEDLTLDLPIVMSQTDAKQIAEVWLFNLWFGRTTFRTKTHWGNIDLDVSDVVTLPLPSGNRQARITNMSIGADLSIEWELQEELSQNFQPASLSTDGFGFTEQQILSSSLTETFLLDIPLLQALDATGGQFSRAYFAMNGFSNNWPGGVLLRSLDEESFSEVGSTFDGVPWGVVITALAAPPRNCYTVFDDTNTITFFPERESAAFTSMTDLQVLNGANGALLGREIIQFVNAVSNADGSITLSRLIRGRLGTDQHISTHTAGERLILLRAQEIEAHDLPLSQINRALRYRGVTVSHLQQTADIESFTYTGADLKPYSPVFLRGSLSGDNRVITWRRRTRFNRPKLIGTAPLNEASEQYELELRSNGQLLRTVTGISSPTHTYTLADWLADTGGGTGEQNISNRSFEDGDLTSWVPTGGTNPWSVVQSAGLITAAQSGSFFARSVENLVATHTLSQTVDLIENLHYTSEEIRHLITFSAECYTAKGNSSNDTIEFQVRFLNSVDAVIATETTGAINQTADGAWVLRSLSGNIPRGTAKIQLRVIVVETATGTNVQLGVDSFKLTIGTGVPKLEATVYQISEAVGRGFARTEDV